MKAGRPPENPAPELVREHVREALHAIGFGLSVIATSGAIISPIHGTAAHGFTKL